MIRFVKAHPEWSYARVGEIFGITRQAIGQLIIADERRRGIKFHIRQRNTKPPHLEHCLACQRTIEKLQEDPAQTTADLYPSQEHRGYHLGQIRKAGALKGAILFQSKKMLKAYRAWRDGATISEIRRRYGYRNWHGSLDKLGKECPSIGRYEKRDLRPNWQKDLEGHDIKRLTRFKLYGSGVDQETRRRIPFKQSVHARNKKLALQNAGVTLLKMRGIKPITLRVERWEDGGR